MKRWVLMTTALAFSMAFFAPTAAEAQVGKGLSGAHYTLNIIGVPHDKTADMTGTQGHTIFVPLQSGGDVSRQVKIYYVAGDRFEVLDRNATDDNEATIMVPSEPEGDLSFDVYAVGLGKPNGQAIVTAECTIEDLIGDCTDALLMGGFEVNRPKGKPQRLNITDVFRATGCLDLNATGVCDAGDLGFKEVWIFNITQLLEYYWDYDNNGLKLMQVRFYETTSGQFCDGPCQ